MTKAIRIENADTSSWPVRVTVQDRIESGEWVDTSTKQLDAPTALEQFYLTSSRRLVIEERKADE